MKEKHFRKFAREYPEPHAALTMLGKVLQEFRRHAYDIDQEDEFIAICKDITKDRHLMSIVLSDQGIVNAYNQLVECYQLMKKSHADFDELSSTVSGNEKGFLANVGEIGSDKELRETSSKSKKLALLYNTIILIYNSVKKKQELGKGIK